MIFICIHLERSHVEAPHLLKYMFFIREMNKLHGDTAWRSYDESFRHLKETADLPWQKPVDELRIRAIAMPAKHNNNPPFRGKQAGRAGIKFCYAFNQGDKCKSTSCRYVHVCQSCRGNHPKFKSKKKNRIKNPNLPTPVKTNQLKHELEGYEAAKYLLDGFTDGFRLGCLVPPKANIAKNHKSVYDHPEVIKKHITKGIALGRIAGPFTKPPFENFISSPLGIVPKSEPGKYRIIHDLLYPKNASVNTGVPRANAEVHYDSIDTIVDLVYRHGRGCLMAKTDIEDAFRIIPIHPLDHSLLGFSFEGEFYFDRCLPMGASSSCQIFE